MNITLQGTVICYYVLGESRFDSGCGKPIMFVEDKKEEDQFSN